MCESGLSGAWPRVPRTRSRVHPSDEFWRPYPTEARVPTRAVLGAGAFGAPAIMSVSRRPESVDLTIRTQSRPPARPEAEPATGHHHGAWSYGRLPTPPSQLSLAHDHDQRSWTDLCPTAPKDSRRAAVNTRARTRP